MSLTCVPCKLLVHIVCSDIMAYLDEYQLLFRKRHICETQLTTVIKYWVEILDKGEHVDTFILDFEKTFEPRFMNFLKANCLVKALAVRYYRNQPY